MSGFSLKPGSPMDVSLERKKLREIAIKTAQRESEPQPPHIFDELPRIPKPNQFTEKVVEEEASVKTESVHSKKAEDEDEDEDEKENEFEDESDEFEEDSEEESWTEEET